MIGLGWSIFAVTYNVSKFSHEQWVRDQELEFIEQGLINPYEGLENIPRHLSHNDPEEIGPLTPED